LKNNSLLWLLLVAFLWRCFAALYFDISDPGNEIFQSLEPAHRLAFGTGILNWEFHDGLRSYFLPFIYAGIMWLCAFISDSPVLYLSIIKILLSAISVIPVYVTYRLVELVSNKSHALLVAIIPAFWYELVFYGSTTLLGILPAHLLILAMYWVSVRPCKSSRSATSVIVLGFVLGLVAFLRFHYSPAIALTAVYYCRRDLCFSWRWLVVGFLVSFVPLGLLDWVTWSYPFQSILQNFYDNIILHVASSGFGSSPYYYFIRRLAEHWLIFFPAVIYFAFRGRKYAPLFFYNGLLMLVVFSCISHKEFRFIYIVIVCWLVSAAFGFSSWVLAGNSDLKKRSAVWIIGVYVVVQCAALFYQASKNENPWLPMMQYLNHELYNSQVQTPAMIFIDTDYFSSGGYTYLNANVPLEFSKGSAGFEIGPNKTNLINWVITAGPVGGAEPFHCIGLICAYKTYYKISPSVIAVKRPSLLKG